MASPVSASAVCNLALDYVKQATLSDITSPISTVESIAARHYDITREMVLKSHPWSFARRRRRIARNSTDPTFGYDDAYDLPNDFLKILSIGTNYTESYAYDYSIEGNQILLDNMGAETLNITYVRDETDVRRFDPMFTKLLAAELAIIFAATLIGKPSATDAARKFRDEIEQKAKAANGQENPVKVRRRSRYSGARAQATYLSTVTGLKFQEES